MREHPKHLPAMPPRPGEQLSFQPQPPPALNTSPPAYSELGVERTTDGEVVRRIQVHLRGVDLPSMFADECKKNVSLADFWLTTQSRVVPTQDSWERFYAQIGTCSLHRNQQVIDELLYDLSRM